RCLRVVHSFPTRRPSDLRSMATRGSLGGLSKKAVDAADVLDAAGYDIIIFETVGVGQSELDIAQAADTTIVVLVPESGDTVQARSEEHTSELQSRENLVC